MGFTDGLAILMLLDLLNFYLVEPSIELVTVVLVLIEPDQSTHAAVSFLSRLLFIFCF